MPGVINVENIYKEYENTKDVCKFCKDYEENDIATRFLLIRSLDKSNLDTAALMNTSAVPN